MAYAGNYNPFYVDPGNDFSSGLAGLSNTMANIRQGRIDQAKQDALDAQAQRQQEANDAATKAFQTNDPTEMAKVSLQYPEIADNLRKTIGLDTEGKAKEAGDFARRLLTASPDQRPSIYEERINKLQKEGRDPSHTMQSYQDYQKNPNGELQSMETVWAAADPEGYSVIADQHKAAQQQAMQKQKMDQQQLLQQQRMDQANQLFQQAEAGRNARASARAAREGGAAKLTANRQDFDYYQNLKESDPEAAKAFGQKVGFVSKEGRELSGQVQKRLSTSIDTAVSAENNVGKYTGLADEIERVKPAGGFFGAKVPEAIKEFMGDQDAVTALRKEAAAVRASQASANLPPGSASDADMKIALGPLPSDNASPQLWASWLRGQAKLQRNMANFHNFKADYMSENGSERGMLQAWKAQNQSPTPAPIPAPQKPAIQSPNSVPVAPAAGVKFLGFE